MTELHSRNLAGSRSACRSGAPVIIGLILISMGLAVFANNLGYVHIRLGQLWPLWLIGWGVLMLAGWGSRGRGRSGGNQ